MLGLLFPQPANARATDATSPRLWWAHTAVATLLVCAAYHAAGALGIALRFEAHSPSGIWLPHGILVAALLTAPVRRWWVYAAGLLPIHVHLMTFLHEQPPATVPVIQFAGNFAMAALAALLLRRVLGRPPRLDSLSRMGAYIVGATFVAPVVVVALMVPLLISVGWADEFWAAWQARVLSRMCGAVIVGAPALYLATGGLTAFRRAPVRRVAEFVALSIVLLGLLVLAGWEPARSHHRWLLFAPLALLLWSAVRFGPAGLGSHLLAIALMTLLNTKAGRGPFVMASAAETVFALQGFFLAISVPLMLLAALVRQHAHAAASLRQSQAQYRSVIEDQTELICRFLPDGTYTFVNGAYGRYFDRAPESLLGEKFWQFVPAEQQPASRAFLQTITPDHPVATIEHPVAGADGKVRWQHWTDRGFFDEHGRIFEYQAVGHDITERKRAEEEHQKRVAQERVAEALREVDRRKDEFLAVLAHELRNPLAPIALAAELIRIRNPADESIAWARDVIARQTAQLTRLVDDLLDVSRITLGKIKLNPATFDLRRVIGQAIEAAQPLLSARRHTLAISMPDQPQPIRGDAARLMQIISNLLNNAAKFTRDGGRITLSVRRADEQVVVGIADNGVGIPAHMLERVFDMFTQVEGAGERAHDGLGIGLALVKRLVEMHGGDIEARSDGPGCGSEIVVRLPLADDQEADAGAAAGPAVAGAPERSGPLRILVVDDNVDAADSLSRLLRLHRHEVQVAHDGLAALAAAPGFAPDVVLLDLGMPKLGGLEVAVRLRDDGSRALLVALTGFGQADDRARTAAAGFDHHLTKPVDPQQLLALLRTVRRAGRDSARVPVLAARERPGGEGGDRRQHDDVRDVQP
jgi:PAS domain S-box-containing protein